MQVGRMLPLPPWMMRDCSFLEQNRHHHLYLRRGETRRMSRQGLERPPSASCSPQRKGVANLYDHQQMRRTADVNPDEATILLLDHSFLKQDWHHYQQLRLRVSCWRAA